LRRGFRYLRKPKRKANPSLAQPVLLTTSTNTVCESFLSVCTTDNAIINANVVPILKIA